MSESACQISKRIVDVAAICGHNGVNADEARDSLGISRSPRLPPLPGSAAEGTLQIEKRATVAHKNSKAAKKDVHRLEKALEKLCTHSSGVAPRGGAST